MFNRKQDIQQEDPTSPVKVSMLEALDGAKDIFAMLAGMRQQAIDLGFSEEVAELLVLELLRKKDD